METLKHILKKYKNFISDEKAKVIPLPIGRHKDFPRLLAELGFNKGAEVGVYQGKYSNDLLRRIPDLYLIGVDLWESYPGYKDFDGNGLDKAFVMAKEVYDKYPKAMMIRGDSVESANEVPDESLDFVFIDGNHAYEFTVADIAAWEKKVRKGGIISGHDYDDYSNHRRYKEMNVINAVNGWCDSYKIAPLFLTTNNKNKCWFYVKQ